MQKPIPVGTRVHLLTDDENDGKTAIVKHSPFQVMGDTDHMVRIDGPEPGEWVWVRYVEMMIERDQPATNHGAF